MGNDKMKTVGNSNKLPTMLEANVEIVTKHWPTLLNKTGYRYATYFCI